MAKKLLIVVFIIPLLYVFLNLFAFSMFWNEARAAISNIPYQMGLKYARILPCYTTGKPPVCVGGTLCPTRDAARCLLYSDVSGTMAGGMGMNAIFLKTAIAKAGLVPGADMIAGVMSPVMTESGILASWGGCSGCTGAGIVKAENYSKLIGYLNKINNFVISGFKE
jgi:hypothetical protein